MLRICALTLIGCFVAAALAAQSGVPTITPSSGLTRGGELVDIRGTNLLAAGCPGPACPTLVTFGGNFATIVFNTAEEMIVVAPPHAAGPVDVVISVGGASPVVVPCGFTFQAPAATESVRFLLPIAGNTSGALNTTWRTDVSVTNENAVPVTIAGATVQPLTTKTALLSSLTQFVDIPRELSDGVTISVRVHDTTHDADNRGVDIPVVPPSQFRKSVILAGLPSDPRYRMLLRIYGYGGAGSAVVRVRDAGTGALLEQLTAELVGSAPSYAQVPLNTSAAAVRTVEVTTAGRADPPIWAFVSVTNNITQQVTLVTPRIGVAGTASTDAPLLATGHWGGNGCLDVSEQDVYLGATCAFGTFMRPRLDPDGHFEVDGVWQTAIGPSPPPGVGGDPAHFSGIVQGTKLTLVVRTGSRVLGPLLVELGSTIPCPPGCP